MLRLHTKLELKDVCCGIEMAQDRVQWRRLVSVALRNQTALVVLLLGPRSYGNVSYENLNY